MSIQARLSHCQTYMPTVLKRYLPQKNEANPLSLAMHYACLNGGKRLRPLLVYTTAEMFDAPWDKSSPLCAAIEMIHCYSLIHDDLPAMDNDDLRRGKPTCHKVFGEAMAILAGDALFTLAFEILSHPEHFPNTRESVLFQIMQVISKASGAQGMVKGQAIDIQAQGQSFSLAQLIEMHQAKTGALLTASVQCGALISESANDDDLSELQNYGYQIGLGFQIQDDILDALGTSEIMGKHPGQDAKNNKCTFVSVLGTEGARAYASNCYEQALAHLDRFGKKANDLRALTTYLFERMI